jgi:hypothetical protein
MAGPASLEVVLTSTAPETDIYAVISDVWPDGSSHPVAAGRLRTAYPEIDLSRSLIDDAGEVVQPYGRYDVRNPAGIGEARRYFVELWPIGNRFDAGHRLRLHVVGASAASQPSLPALNTIRLGSGGSRLLVPVLPGDDLGAALGVTTADGSAAVAAAVPEPAPLTVAVARGDADAALPATGTSFAPAAALIGLSAALAARLVLRAPYSPAASVASRTAASAIAVPASATSSTAAAWACPARSEMTAASSSCPTCGMRMST